MAFRYNGCMMVRFVKPEELEAHTAFVAQHPRGGIEQSWSWGVLQSSIPGRKAMFVLGVFDKDEVTFLGSMMMVRQEMGHGKTWLWCPRGPLLPERGAFAAWTLLQEHCKKLAKKGGDVFLRVEPSMLEKDPLVVQGRPAVQSYMPEHSLFLNLESSLESIQAQMTQKGRYNIKKAQKAGIYVRKGTPEEMPELYEVLLETAKRDGFHVHEEDFYERFLELLDGGAKLYVARYEQELVGGLLATHFGDRATYYFGASSNAHRNKMAPYALQWFAIQEAKKAGLKRYDFLGVAPEGDEKDVLAGVTQFKTRFGGKRVAYQKAQVFVYRPLWHWAYLLAKYARRLRP